ncbi:anthranilate synthase component [Fomitiporia mediterranea MF3/22]|uniref:anthranilate synthase component n=1 Tax=Fomitiporia mediterranea (strain MF3/22) TaxID=694068 RepID=UPI00044093DE|nr:anthranilate synthase component [Fomitiporia mediterranea MF3/22]EJD05970.1 anthranilate synthase component [Fomitiporia mediterranea MF3/22]
MDPQSLVPFPPLATVEQLILNEKRGNCVPIFVQLPADLLTPCTAYLKIAKDSKYSFLLESIIAGENIARYSFIGADPIKVIKTGPREEATGDPMNVLQKELAAYHYVKIPEVPTFTGGAIGYVSYDCIQYFEPKTSCQVKDPLGIPEAFFMLADTIVIYDHLFQNIKVVSHVFSATNSPQMNLSFAYNSAVEKTRRIARILLSTAPIPEPLQPPIVTGQHPTSNVGRDGYEAFVTKLKQRIVAGDIIQAVPSQRLARPTTLHPFNAYRQLRQVNPSPYMFYVDCGDVQVVGASPETLCKVERNKVYNHAIAGTTKRGKTPEEDERLGNELQSSEKDRSEHIMLVDLARNDVNRVCQAKTVKVDHLMRLEKFSHVIHLTSQVSGILRDGLTRFDAFRSIFPAGTVSGAPKIKAIELIYSLEREKRGVYAGAVGRWDFAQDEMDTCIAIRTMLFKDGVAYLQAGGGIVFDSVEEDEYVETVNKLKGNLSALEAAEAYWLKIQQAQSHSTAAS